MDVVQGNFKFDIHTGKPVGPPIARVGPLAPEIAGEGEKVILSDGTRVSFKPPSNKPIMPDWSEIEVIKHYFNRTDFYAWPAWFYHPAEEAVLLTSPEEAEGLIGIVRRESTADERGKYGVGKYTWDWPEGCMWRPFPYPENMPGKFDPHKPGHGKVYVPVRPDPTEAQNMLMRELVEAFKNGGHKSGIDGETLLKIIAAIKGDSQGTGVLEAEAPAEKDHERIAWEAKAREVGIKPDGRWSLDRLKKEVETKLIERTEQSIDDLPPAA